MRRRISLPRHHRRRRKRQLLTRTGWRRGLERRGITQGGRAVRPWAAIARSRMRGSFLAKMRANLASDRPVESCKRDQFFALIPHVADSLADRMPLKLWHG